MHTFIVRLWAPPPEEFPDPAAQQSVRGFVEDVSSGLAERFRSSEELLALLDPTAQAWIAVPELLIEVPSPDGAAGWRKS